MYHIQDELQMGMRLIGARTIDELTPDLVDASGVHTHVGITPTDNLYNATCTWVDYSRPFSVYNSFVLLSCVDQPLALAQFKPKL